MVAKFLIVTSLLFTLGLILSVISCLEAENAYPVIPLLLTLLACVILLRSHQSEESIFESDGINFHDVGLFCGGALLAAAPCSGIIQYNMYVISGQALSLSLISFLTFIVALVVFLFFNKKEDDGFDF